MKSLKFRISLAAITLAIGGFLYLQAPEAPAYGWTCEQECYHQYDQCASSGIPLAACERWLNNCLDGCY